MERASARVALKWAIEEYLRELERNRNFMSICYEEAVNLAGVSTFLPKTLQHVFNFEKDIYEDMLEEWHKAKTQGEKFTLLPKKFQLRVLPYVAEEIIGSTDDDIFKTVASNGSVEILCRFPDESRAILTCDFVEA